MVYTNYFIWLNNALFFLIHYYLYLTFSIPKLTNFHGN